MKMLASRYFLGFLLTCALSLHLSAVAAVSKDDVSKIKMPIVPNFWIFSFEFLALSRPQLLSKIDAFPDFVKVCTNTKTLPESLIVPEGLLFKKFDFYWENDRITKVNCYAYLPANPDSKIFFEPEVDMSEGLQHAIREITARISQEQKDSKLFCSKKPPPQVTHYLKTWDWLFDQKSSLESLSYRKAKHYCEMAALLHRRADLCKLSGNVSLLTVSKRLESRYRKKLALKRKELDENQWDLLSESLN